MNKITLCKLNFCKLQSLVCLGLIFLSFALNLEGHEPSEIDLPTEKPMVVIIPSYNNENWLELNLDSVMMQKYSNYRVIYINDKSKDKTALWVETYLKESQIDYRVIEFDDENSEDIEAVTQLFAEKINQERHFFTLIHNVNRFGALGNLYRAIQSSSDEEIVVSLDGDDWLYHENVLKDLNTVYSSQEVWFTHGTLMEYPWGGVTWCEPIQPEAMSEGTYRKYKCPSHLRTFYAWLFKKIKLEDLLWDGKFFAMAWDMAIMYPLCEMAQERHAFISNVSYVYNMENSINDNKVDPDLQNNMDRIIRNKPSYSRMEKP